jgi:hypothetical protein
MRSKGISRWGGSKVPPVSRKALSEGEINILKHRIWNNKISPDDIHYPKQKGYDGSFEGLRVTVEQENKARRWWKLRRVIRELERLHPREDTSFVKSIALNPKNRFFLVGFSAKPVRVPTYTYAGDGNYVEVNAIEPIYRVDVLGKGGGFFHYFAHAGVPYVLYGDVNTYQ